MELKAAAKGKSRQLKGDETTRAEISMGLKKTTKHISNIYRKIRQGKAEDKDHDRLDKLKRKREKLWDAT